MWWSENDNWWHSANEWTGNGDKEMTYLLSWRKLEISIMSFCLSIRFFFPMSTNRLWNIIRNFIIYGIKTYISLTFIYVVECYFDEQTSNHYVWIYICKIEYIPIFAEQLREFFYLGVNVTWDDQLAMNISQNIHHIGI